MRPTSILRSLPALAGSSLIAISCAQATVYYWDSNGSNGTAGFGSTSGTWGTSAFRSTNITGGGGAATANTTILVTDDNNLNDGHDIDGVDNGIGFFFHSPFRMKRSFLKSRLHSADPGGATLTSFVVS